MVRKQVVRTQQLKFMFLNLIAFTVIFSIFGVLIFSLVQNTLFTKIDEELLRLKEKVIETTPPEVRPPDRNDHFDRPPLPPDNARPKKDLNPRIIIIEWNEQGEIINKEQIGSFLYESYLKDYELNKAEMNVISPIIINELYHFRSILFEDMSGIDGVYTQLMINVDAEKTVLNNFQRLLMISSLVFIFLSISASIFLSKKMMKPIITSWDKQAEFVENASHELRTPLTIIQNKLEMLLTTPDEKIANRFENIALSLSETRRLSKLTSDLLTLARADSAQTQLEKSLIDLDCFVQEVCLPYKEIAESQEKHLWLNTNSKMKIEVDRIRFHQLLIILLDNALKYTNLSDSIGIKTYVEDGKAVIEISDTGIGIKTENSKHVFERFYREDKARSRETGGMGLGLSIAQWIVLQHKGTIIVRQNGKKGTVFIVKLPK